MNSLYRGFLRVLAVRRRSKGAAREFASRELMRIQVSVSRFFLRQTFFFFFYIFIERLSASARLRRGYLDCGPFRRVNSRIFSHVEKLLASERERERNQRADIVIRSFFYPIVIVLRLESKRSPRYTRLPWRIEKKK